MIDSIKTVLDQRESRLIEDCVGLVALFVILVGGLHLPALV